MQKGASFNLDAVKEKIAQAMKEHQQYRTRSPEAARKGRPPSLSGIGKFWSFVGDSPAMGSSRFPRIG